MHPTVRKLLLSTLLAPFLLAQKSQLYAEDWTTINGKFYSGVQVIKVEPDAVTILYRDGGALLPLKLLPDNLQQRFHYDAAAARRAAEIREKADEENLHALSLERLQVEALKVAAAQQMPPSPTPSTEVAQTPSVSTSHYTIDDLIQINHRLRDDAFDKNHHSINDLDLHGSWSDSADDRHHSKDSLFDGF